MKCLSECPNFKNCIRKLLVTRLYYNCLSTGYFTKKPIHKFFVTAIKKDHEHAICIDFQFHNLELSQKGILDVHVATAIVELCMKEVIDNSLPRAL